VKPLLLLAQTETDDGVFVPDDAGSAVVFVVFIGILAALYLLVGRTRKRAEDEFWRRKRQEREDRPD